MQSRSQSSLSHVGHHNHMFTCTVNKNVAIKATLWLNMLTYHSKLYIMTIDNRKFDVHISTEVSVVILQQSGTGPTQFN